MGTQNHHHDRYYSSCLVVRFWQEPCVSRLPSSNPAFQARLLATLLFSGSGQCLTTCAAQGHTCPRCLDPLSPLRITSGERILHLASGCPQPVSLGTLLLVWGRWGSDRLMPSPPLLSWTLGGPGNLSDPRGPSCHSTEPSQDARRSRDPQRRTSDNLGAKPRPPEVQTLSPSSSFFVIFFFFEIRVIGFNPA